MSEPQGSVLDTLVEWLARAMDAVGLNGRRVRWRWNQRRRAMGEAGVRGEQMLRSAQTRHKMCRACRALVPRDVTRCPDCGESLAGVTTPGTGRVLSNLLPGAARASSLILLVNGLLFILMLMTPDPRGAAGGGLMSFPGETLLRFGGGYGPLVLIEGEWFRLFTSLFLHSGLIHFGFNTWVLLQLGPIVEDLYGPARFWTVYLAAGVCGNLLAQLVFQQLVVGASGAIIGLIGVLLGYGVRSGGERGHGIRALMLRYAMYMLIFSLLPGISLASHFGGFVGGFIGGWLIPDRQSRPGRESAAWQVLALLGVGLVLLSFWQVATRGNNFLDLL